jgi:MYXO-CTERM domain-containing protein
VCDECSCGIRFDTAASGQPHNTFGLNINFEVDPTSQLTTVKIADAGITDDIEGTDIDIDSTNTCGLAVCNLADLDFIKNLFITTLEDSLMGTLDDTLFELTCRTCGDAGCPTGSTCEGGSPDDLCIWDDTGECVPMALGVEGRMDVGSLLASFSPGAEGSVDLFVNAGGYADVAGDGVNLGVFGGLDAVEHDECVSIAPVPCEGDGDCAGGFTCREVDAGAAGVFACRRCGEGCPEGSTPSEKCLPEDDEDTDFDPTALCIDDDTGECVPVRYCADDAGVLQASSPPPLGPVPVATDLQVDSFSHCLLCPTGSECSDGFTCSASGVCTDADGACEIVVDDVMAVAGISETFLRRALYGFVDSGAACLEVLPGLVPQLNTSLFGLAAAPSLDNVVWDNQPLAIVLKPEVAYYASTDVETDRLNSPDVFLANDPAMQIQLNNVTLDFYAWVEETYSRFETVTLDLILGVDLEVHDNMLTPVIRDPVVQDVRVTNSDLLEDDPDSLRVLFGGVIELAMGFLPPLDPIEIPEIEGIVLEIPDGGVGHVEQDGEDFLALYAQLDLAPPSPPPPADAAPAPVETEVEVVEAYVPPVDEHRGTAAQFAACDRPEFKVRFSATGGGRSGRPYEYRYRVDGAWWSEWTRNETAIVSRRAFVFQGAHTLEVQARVAGLWHTEDPTPAAAELLVDGLAPTLRLERVPEGLAVHARDLVTEVEDLEVSFRVGDGPWYGLEPPFVVDASRLSGGHGDVEIEVVDEAGNVTYGEYGIRGRPPGTDDTSSCGSCAVTGEGGDVPVLVLVLALVALLVSRRRRRARREDVEEVRR